MKNSQLEQQFDHFNQWFKKVTVIEKEVNAIANQVGLSFDQYLVLREIAKAGSIIPSDLTRRFNVSKPAVSRKINALFDVGLIDKQHEVLTDRRKVVIVLTKTGQETATVCEQRYYKWLTKTFPNNIDTDFNLLGSLTNSITKTPVA